jgi:hypothetical protein
VCLGLGALLLVLAAISISANILRRNFSTVRAGGFSSWESFVEKAATKHKIVINFSKFLAAWQSCTRSDFPPASFLSLGS